MAAVALLATTGCRGDAAAEIRDRDRWRRATAALLTDARATAAAPATDVPPIILEVLPPGGPDAYVTAVAVIALDGAVPDRRSTSDVLRRELLRQLDDHLVGPTYLAHAVVKALSLMGTSPDSTRLTAVVDDEIARPTATATNDLFSVLATVELARELRYRQQDTMDWARSVLRIAGCPGDVASLGAAGSIDPALLPCDRTTIDRVATAAANQVLASPKWGIGECTVAVGLAQLGAIGVRAAEASRIVERAKRALAGGDLDDPLPCVASMRNLIRDREAATPDLDPDLAVYLASVVTAGNEPALIELDTGSALLLLRALAVLGVPQPPEIIDALREGDRGDPVHEVDLLLATAAGLPAAGAIASVVDGGRSRDRSIALRAALVLGADACEAGMLGIASTVLTGSTDRRLAHLGQAARLLRTCGTPNSEVEEAVLSAARETLTGRSSGPERDPDTLYRVWDALAALCAISPSDIGSERSRWAALRVEANDAGGAPDPLSSAFSMERTFLLVTATADAEERCRTTGLLG